MKSKSSIIACLPAYNEEETIAKNIILTQKYVDKIIVCDDGSTDMTAEISEGLGAEVLHHKRNEGYGGAIRSLFKHVKKMNASAVIILDSDGQHNPNEIPKILKPILNGKADIVIGSRLLRDHNEIPNYRIKGIAAISKVSNLITNLDVKDTQSGFRAYSNKAINLITPSEMGMGVGEEILVKASTLGLKIVEVPITVQYDEHNTSHNPVYHGLDVIASLLKHHSIRHPLLFYGLPGAMMLLISLFFGAWTIQIFTVEGRVVTNLALITMGSAIIGLTLIITAIILFVIISVIKEKY